MSSDGALEHRPSKSNPAGDAAGNSIWVRWLWRLTAAAGCLLAATALFPLLPVDWWWVRIGDYPRLQLLLAYVVGLVALLPFLRRRLAKALLLLLLGCCGIQLYWVFPYLPIAPLEVERAESSDSASRLRVLAANVLQSNQDAEPLLKLIAQQRPDIVVVCEVNQRWIDDLAQLEEQFAFHLTQPLENEYGIALYSNVEVLEAEVRHLVADDIPSIDTRIRLRSGHEARLFAVHPNPPRVGEDTTKRDGELVLVGREVQDEPSAIVLGDLNDVGWSRTTNLFQEVGGLLDPRKGRGLYSTYNAKSYIWRYPLDYLFHSEDFRVVQLHALPDIGSDHFPLFVELSHEPDAQATQAAPDLDAGDQEDAADAVQDALETQRSGEQRSADGTDRGVGSRP